MLDFETISPPLPQWDGCRPFGKVPVQFSVHVQSKDGTVTHHAYLAEGQGDPRPAVAEAVAGALHGTATILAWNAPFEKQCLTILAGASPDHADALIHARDNVQDLLPAVRNHVYHPDFRGSFSIKSVVPALIPDMTYDDLEVTGGETASSLLEAILCRPAEVRESKLPSLRKELLAYCERDTAVMAELMRFLHRVARTPS